MQTCISFKKYDITIYNNIFYRF